MFEDPCGSPDGSENPFTDNFSKASVLEEPTEMPSVCGICERPFVNPVILSCLHIYDVECLRVFEKHDGVVPYIKCPRCDTLSGGLKTLEAYDATIVHVQDVQDNLPDGKTVKCSVCTDGNEALYRCLHCAGTLCERCRDIHKVMKVFSNHVILDLTEEEKRNVGVLQRNMQNAKPVFCNVHTDYVFTSFCMQCHIPLCEVCFDSDHKGHITTCLDMVPEHVDSVLCGLIDGCRSKQKELRESMDSMHCVLSELSSSRDANKMLINETCKQWINAIERVKDHFIYRNREIHDEWEMKMWSRIHSISKTIDHIDFACEFVKSYLKKCSVIELCKLTKSVVACFDKLSKQPILNDQPVKVLFNPGYSVAHDIVRQQFGTFDFQNSDSGVSQSPSSMLQTFSRSDSHIGSLSGAGDVSDELKRLTLKVDSQLNSDCVVSLNGTLSAQSPLSPERQNAAHIAELSSINVGNGSLENYFGQSNSAFNPTRSVSNWNELDVGIPNVGQSDFISNVTQVDSCMLSNFLSSDMIQNSLQATSVGPGIDGESNSILKQKIPAGYNASLYEYCRLRAARCSQMNLLTKWGSLGCELGRLNSPHGFCLGFEEEIVVADTYNHRIQIFTKRGDFVSFFGVSGRVDGLMWYPRKVAIIRQSQRYVVCDRGNERSRMQLFSRSGHFVRRIPIRYIYIVAGLAINQHGHIVAIDSVSPSVFVVSEEGDLIRWFDCSNHMREPSDVAIHGREYYICDFKAHCVIVFQEDGTFVRRIGGESITDFPNGIDVSDHGDVLVGDSHGNRLHIAVFRRTGELLSEFVCNQTKVSRSCCLKITTEGYVVTLARSSNNVLVIDTLYIC